ncbi:MAG: phosphohydrolase, partial [Pedobacter sp.]
MNYTQLQDDAKSYVLNYFTQHHDAKLVYHDLKHTEDVVAATVQIANHYQLSEEDFFIVYVAAWFHDTGYFEDIVHHEEKSTVIAKRFLSEQNVPEELISKITEVILSTRMPQKPVNLLESILCDADLFHLGQEDFRKKGKLMQKEAELLGKKISKKDWRKKNFEYLAHQNYHTDYGRLLLNDQKAKNLEKLEKRLNEEEAEEEITVSTPIVVKGEEKLLNTKDKARPDKGIETMFRITSANNQRLSDMADNKAQLLITVNSIILSLIVSLVLRRLEDNAFLIVPTFILLMVSLSCIIYSILATRPSIPEGVFTEKDIENKKVNLLFFGNFYKMDLKDYSNGMIKVMNDQEFLYGTLITDVYSQGVV